MQVYHWSRHFPLVHGVTNDVRDLSDVFTHAAWTHVYGQCSQYSTNLSIHVHEYSRYLGWHSFNAGWTEWIFHWSIVSLFCSEVAQTSHTTEALIKFETIHVLTKSVKGDNATFCICLASETKLAVTSFSSKARDSNPLPRPTTFGNFHG